MSEAEVRLLALGHRQVELWPKLPVISVRPTLLASTFEIREMPATAPEGPQRPRIVAAVWRKEWAN